MKRFVAVLVGLALVMTARPAVARERAPVETSPQAVGLVTGKDVVLDSVELLDGTGTASCDDDGVLDTGETARVRVTLRNNGTERLKWTSMTLSSTDPDVSIPQAPTVYFRAMDPGQSDSQELPVALSGAATPRDISLRIAYRDAEQTVSGDKTHTVTYRVNIDERPGTSTLETVESTRHPWTVTVPPAGVPSWTRQSDTTGAWFFRGPANTVTTDLSLISPPLQVSATEAFSVSFQQRYAFEASPAGFYYDGAIIELSQDDGESWVGLEDVVSPPYNATIDTEGNNPLKGKKAYGGQSPGYPAFTKATLSLGTRYAGKTVRLRFRIGTDGSMGATGWDLDDLQLVGVVNTPFTTLEPHREGKCLNRVPIADAGLAQSVDEGRFVTLSGSGTDPEGDPLTYEWKQTKGPSVTLSDPGAARPTFLAPEVTGHTDLEFELRVSDGVTTSPPDGVTVRVRDLSPVAEVKPVGEVDEGTKVTLEGSASSADEAAEFTYTWTQLEPEGLSVTLSDSTSATPSFTAPQVDADTTLTFQLVVSDGESESGPATVTVLVRDVPNEPPVAQAGADQAVRAVSGVTLNGSESKDPEGSALIYTWTQVDGPTVKLIPEGPKARFNAPEVDEETAFTFELQVKDASGLSGKDTVTVRVSNTPPGNGSGGGCAAGQGGGEPTTALLLLAALGFVLRRPRWRSL